MKASIDNDNVFLRSETLFCACATIFQKKTNSAHKHFCFATGTFARNFGGNRDNSCKSASRKSARVVSFYPAKSFFSTHAQNSHLMRMRARGQYIRSRVFLHTSEEVLCMKEKLYLDSRRSSSDQL